MPTIEQGSSTGILRHMPRMQRAPRIARVPRVLPIRRTPARSLSEPVRVRTEDNVFQHLEVLKRNRQKRHRSGEFFVEGVRSINQARERRWTVKMVAFAADRPLSSWARDLLAAEPSALHLELSPHLMDALSDKEEPSELIAIL